MSINYSLEPMDPREFGYTQAGHLLHRAGFGGTAQQILELQMMGLEGAVDYLVDYRQIDDSGLEDPRFDPDIIHPPTPEEQAKRSTVIGGGDTDEIEKTELERQRSRAKDLFQMHEVERWWLQRMVDTPRPLEERLTLMWHGHFPSNYRVVQDSYLMFKQNQLLRQRASGAFTDLLLGVVKDPAMLLFLSNVTNDEKAPNQKMARVLLERFALGIGNFSERDVQETARALTGYGVYDNHFLFDHEKHDGGPKVVLGERKNLDGEDLVDIILRRQDCHRWIVRRLYMEFVADLDSSPSAKTRPVIQGLARVLADHHYQIGPVLKHLFKSQHFYDPGIMGNKIKNPVQLLVGTARLLRTPRRDPQVLAVMMDRMGQRLFGPPSYNDWPEGKGWINTSTLYSRHNACVYAITGKVLQDRQWSGDQIRYDPQPLLSQLPRKTPEAVVDFLVGTLLTVPITPARRGELVKFLAQRKRITTQTLIVTLLLITALPEYQIC